MTDRKEQRDRASDLEKEIAVDEQDPQGVRPVEPNPPHTTTGRVTAPKFGSATSGGGELEPGSPRP